MLKQLGAQHGNTVERRLARSALGAGLREMSKRIRAAAPKGTRIKKSVSDRMKKSRRTGQHEAKSGLNVGRKKDTAPHAHFFTLGTADRETKDGRKRGRVIANRFVRQAIEQGGTAVVAAMLNRIRVRLPTELARLRKQV